MDHDGGTSAAEMASTGAHLARHVPPAGATPGALLIRDMEADEVHDHGRFVTRLGRALVMDEHRQVIALRVDKRELAGGLCGMSTARRFTLRLALLPAILSLLATVFVGLTAAPAQAAVTPGSKTFGVRVLAEAAKHKHKQYAHGGKGPRVFDCSGFTRYVYGKAVKKHLPRTSRAQYAAARKISRSQVRPGDLVFFRSSSGRVYHVAIYAGGGRIWHASNPRTDVLLSKIWTKNWVAGRAG